MNHDTVLVLIDVQKKLNAVIHQKEALLNKIEILLKSAIELEIPIIWLEQYPKGLGTTEESLKEILKTQNLEPIVKNTFSAYQNEAFREKLASIGRSNILVAGTEAHICVYQTVRDLLFKGFMVEVIADCIGSRTNENKEIGIDRMISLGASLTSLELFLFECMESADHPSFKTISRLIK